MRFFRAWQDYISGNFEGAEFNGDPYGPLFAKKRQAFATTFYNDIVRCQSAVQYEKFVVLYDNFHIKLVKAYPTWYHQYHTVLPLVWWSNCPWACTMSTAPTVLLKQRKQSG